MAHMLARLRNVPIDIIAPVLKADVGAHSKEGLYLEHLWQNDDDANEVLFLFRVDDLNHARQFIDRVHAEARTENPKVNLPTMTFLAEK
jgi:hypothetical protein